MATPTIATLPLAFGLLLASGCTSASVDTKHSTDDRVDPALAGRPASATEPEELESAPASPATMPTGALFVASRVGGSKLEFLADGADEVRALGELEGHAVGEGLALSWSEHLVHVLTEFDIHTLGPSLELQHLASVPVEYTGETLVEFASAGGTRLWLNVFGRSMPLLRFDGGEWVEPRAHLASVKVNDIAVAGDGTVWISVEGELRYLQPSTARWVTIRDDIEHLVELQPTPTGGIAVLTRTELLLHPNRAPDADEFVSRAHGVDSPFFFAIADDGGVAIGERRGAVRVWAPGSEEPRYKVRFGDEDNAIMDLGLDTEGRAWVVSYDGVTIIGEGGRERIELARYGPMDAQAVAVMGAGPSPETLVAHARNEESREGPREPVFVPRGFVLQLASRTSLADAEAQRERVDEALDEPTYVLARDGLYLVVAGNYPSRGEAETSLEAGKAVLAEGGFVRQIGKFCPGIERASEALFRCP